MKMRRGNHTCNRTTDSLEEFVHMKENKNKKNKKNHKNINK